MMGYKTSNFFSAWLDTSSVNGQQAQWTPQAKKLAGVATFTHKD